MNRRPAEGEPVPLAQLDSRITVTVRESLISSYPEVDVDEIAAIVRSYGMRSLPDSLFLEGDVDDDGEAGMRSRLRAASDAEKAHSTPLHPLFSATFYDLMYPSVKEQGLSPWMHFHVFGVSQGLSPHFLLDVDYLGHTSAHLEKAKRIDTYLTDRSEWFRAPSPYVDIEKFILSGSWDRSRHPLVSVVTSHREWVQDRLMLIDSNWGEAADAQTNAAGFLLSSTNGMAAGSRVLLFEPPRLSESDVAVLSEPADWRVIPGAFLGTEGVEPLQLSRDLLSPDRTMVRLRSSVALLARGDEVPASRLIVVESNLPRGAIDELLSDVEVTDAIAPFDQNQEAVFVAWARTRRGAPAILSWGVQVLVRSAVLVRVKRPAFEPAKWSWNEPRSSAGLVFYLDRVTPAEQRVLADRLRAGAHLCIEASGSIGPWIPELERAEIVVAPPGLVNAVRAVVPDDRIRVMQERNG